MRPLSKEEMQAALGDGAVASGAIYGAQREPEGREANPYVDPGMGREMAAAVAASRAGRPDLRVVAGNTAPEPTAGATHRPDEEAEVSRTGPTATGTTLANMGNRAPSAPRFT